MGDLIQLFSKFILWSTSGLGWKVFDFMRLRPTQLFWGLVKFPIIELMFHVLKPHLAFFSGLE